MKKFSELSISQRVILVGNIVIGFGTMMISIGNLLFLANEGNLPAQPVMGCVTTAGANRTPSNAAQTYFKD